MIDQSEFVDVYSTVNGQKQRVPRIWLDDPVLGRDIRRTPSQRELDGDLPPRPAGDAKAKEIAEYAEAVGLDLSGIKTNADKLVAIEKAFGPAPVQEGVVEVETDPVAADPLAPELVAQVDQPPATEPSAEPAVEDDSDGGGEP